MNDDRRRKEVALFRLAVLGDLIHLQQRRGAQRRALQRKSKERGSAPTASSAGSRPRRSSPGCTPTARVASMG